MQGEDDRLHKPNFIYKSLSVYAKRQCLLCHMFGDNAKLKVEHVLSKELTYVFTAIHGQMTKFICLLFHHFILRSLCLYILMSFIRYNVLSNILSN